MQRSRRSNERRLCVQARGSAGLAGLCPALAPSGAGQAARHKVSTDSIATKSQTSWSRSFVVAMVRDLIEAPGVERVIHRGLSLQLLVVPLAVQLAEPERDRLQARRFCSAIEIRFDVGAMHDCG